MKAIVGEKYGSADVLELKEVDKPSVKDDHVLVRVHAAGVDPGVWHAMTGQPYMMRLMGFGLRGPKARVRGTDAAGLVEAVGKDVARFQPGDEVFGSCDGSFAEYACAHEDKLASKPANLTFEQAAAVPSSAFAALEALRDKGQIQQGDKVLIIGASGGVGTFAVQLAKSFGAEVTGVCSMTKLDLVRSIGADHVIDYTRDDFADGAQLYDLILDTAGTVRCHTSGAPSRREGLSSSSEARGRTLVRRNGSPPADVPTFTVRPPEAAPVDADGRAAGGRPAVPEGPDRSRQGDVGR